MYTPLIERVSKDTPKEERIRHLTDYYRDFLSENLPGTNGTDFDYDVIRSLVEVKGRYRGEQLH